MHAAATLVDQTDVHFWVETLKEGPNLIVNSTLGPDFEFKYTPFFSPVKLLVGLVFFSWVIPFGYCYTFLCILVVCSVLKLSKFSKNRKEMLRFVLFTAMPLKYFGTHLDGESFINELLML